MEIPANLEQKIDRVTETLRELCRSMADLSVVISTITVPELHVIRLYERRLAYNWAKSAHPEWVAILNRTKKRRTRKKYRDRIRRAYYMEV